MFNCKRNSGYMIAVHDHVSNGLRDFVKSLVKDAIIYQGYALPSKLALQLSDTFSNTPASPAKHFIQPKIKACSTVC